MAVVVTVKIDIVFIELPYPNCVEESDGTEVYVYVGLVVNSKEGVVIFVVAVTVPILALVEVNVVSVKTPPVKVKDGAETVDENVVRLGDVVVVINCVFVLTSL